MTEENTLPYERAAFSTRLRRDRLYTAGHYWLRRDDRGLWRIGFTQFAVRLLGDAVEFDFEVKLDSEVRIGQVIGWVEGLKAVTDLFCPMGGQFKGFNPALAERIDLILSDPLDGGWLYLVEGAPGDDCVDVEGYASMLDSAIDKMMGRAP